MIRRAALIALALCCASSQGWTADLEGEDDGPSVRFNGLLDLRAFAAGREISWLRGGTNRLRYGGRDGDADGRGDRNALGASVPQASVVVDASIPPGVSLHLHGNFTTDSPSASARVGLIEAFAEGAKDTPVVKLGFRAGGYIPQLSLEHPNPGWSTRYTLTPSAIGAWIGEELRVFGAEGSVSKELGPVEGKLVAGGFSGGDQIGRLLWFRGWAMHDYQGDLSSEYTVQGRRYSPLSELDGRLGYQGRAELRALNRSVLLSGGTWSNNANPRVGRPGDLDSQAFRTRFYHYGARWDSGRFALAGQLMKVTINAIGKPNRDWNAAYLLGSATLLGKARLSARWDRFWALNWDSGHAWTGFAAWDFSVRQQLAVEYVYSTARPSQAVRPRKQIDRLLQLNYRLRFKI